MPLDGIDISGHQDGIDLSAVPADFVVAKATEGRSFSSQVTSGFVAQARRLGKPLGLYHYLGGDGTAVQEAEHFAGVANRVAEAGPVMLWTDWEAGATARGADWLREHMRLVHELTGIKPMLYTYLFLARPLVSHPVATEYPLWIASYGRDEPITGYQLPEPPGIAWPAGLVGHQYSQKGTLPGWGGQLDLNRFYGDVGDWIRLGSPEGKGKGKTVIELRTPAPRGWLNIDWGHTGKPYSPSRPHKGRDWGWFYASADSLDVVAGVQGTVVKVVSDGGWNDGWGNHVDIELAPGVVRRLAHLDKIVVVVGDRVDPDTYIGRMGSTGDTNGETHLHEELWIDGHRVDPRTYYTDTAWTRGKDPAPEPEEEDEDMAKNTGIQWTQTNDDGSRSVVYLVHNPLSGFALELSAGPGKGHMKQDYMDGVTRTYGIDFWGQVSAEQGTATKAALAAVRPKGAPDALTVVISDPVPAGK